MNVYHAKFMTYYEIHRMRREGHSTSQISKHLVINLFIYLSFLYLPVGRQTSSFSKNLTLSFIWNFNIKITAIFPVELVSPI